MKPQVDHIIEYEISLSDFEHVFGREPKTEGEWDRFCEFSENGLAEQIDWNTVFTCAKDAMKSEEN